MRLANVRISKVFLAQIFIGQEGRCFGVTNGLPADSRLFRLKYDKGEGNYIATFQSAEFKEYAEGNQIPFIEVEFMAYEIVPKEEEPVEQTADTIQ